MFPDSSRNVGAALNTNKLVKNARRDEEESNRATKAAKLAAGGGVNRGTGKASLRKAAKGGKSPAPAKPPGKAFKGPGKRK